MKKEKNTDWCISHLKPKVDQDVIKIFLKILHFPNGIKFHGTPRARNELRPEVDVQVPHVPPAGEEDISDKFQRGRILQLDLGLPELLHDQLVQPPVAGTLAEPLELVDDFLVVGGRQSEQRLSHERESEQRIRRVPVVFVTCDFTGKRSEN